MKDNHKYYIIDKEVLPEVLLKVLEANEMVLSKKCKNISQAIEKVSISRSAYYKYKDKIKPFNQIATDTIVTFSCTLLDEAGVLSKILAVFAESGANILTINQNIPSNGLAIVIISARTTDIKYSIETLISKALQIEGITKFDILSSM